MPPACRLLLTGFEPFAGWPRNPSADLAVALQSDAGLRRAGLRSAVLPVDRVGAPRRLLELLRECRPATVVMTGLAAGRAVISLERIGINCWSPQRSPGPGRPIVPRGPDGLFSTLPLTASLRALGRHGAPAAISESAGTYCCNLVLYQLLLWSRQGFPGGESGPRRVGFVHVPATAESLPPRRCEPCLPADALAASLRELCRVLLRARPR